MSSSLPASAGELAAASAAAPATAASSGAHRSSRSRSRERSSRARSRSPSSSRSRSRSDSRDRRKRDGKDSKRKRRRSRSSSSDSGSSSDSSSDSSSSDSDSGSDHHRSSRKHKKKSSKRSRHSRSRSRSRDRDSKRDRKRSSRKDERKKKKSSKDSKRSKDKDSKKSKKSKKDKSSKAAPAEESLSLTSWGAHGVLHSTDIYTKAAEFYTWCMDIKHLPREQMSKREEKELFAEFAEDFNTSTLPHEKYYDLDAWEKKEHARRGPVDDLAGVADEERIRIERQRARANQSAAAEEARLQIMKAAMAAERASGSEAWKEIERRQQESLKQATFESIAAAREQAKKDEEAIAKHKQRMGKK